VERIKDWLEWIKEWWEKIKALVEGFPMISSLFQREDLTKFE
jgi:hypothetical protein